MTLLEVRNVHTHFDTDKGIVRAVDGVTLDVNAGEIIGLVGESGCGKSMTALSIMRLVPSPAGNIVDGEILLDGEDILKMDPKALRQIRGKKVAMIFQDPMTTLNPVLPVGRQISEVLEFHLGLSRSAARRRTVELLERVGIPAAEKRVQSYPHEFSGGMRQRISIAMALSCEPKLILADEVTTALDVTIQAQILDLLENLTDKFGVAILLITHDLGIIAETTNRVNVMYAGHIVERADTTELFANPQMPYTWGLMRSIPRMDKGSAERLVPIDGRPPDLGAPPTGCRFEPRCEYRRDICREKAPELVDVPNAQVDHQARCWGTQEGLDRGWLRDLDWRTETRGGP